MASLICNDTMLVGGDWNMAGDFFPETVGNGIGMSSSQVTFTPSFFRGVGLNHQPVVYWRALFVRLLEGIVCVVCAWHNPFLRGVRHKTWGLVVKDIQKFGQLFPRVDWLMSFTLWMRNENFHSSQGLMIHMQFISCTMAGMKIP